MSIQETESVKEFGGFLKRYTHQSSSCNCEMTFSVYLPPLAETEKVPAVYWLSGLTCTDDNFRTKAGAQRYASELGIALIIPDTSPRGDDVPDEEDRYDLGKGAGFYVNATQEPWSKNYQMYDYVTKELVELAEQNFPIIPGVRSITGHSMGGHGALICAFKNAGMYQSVSAFAPICNPVNCTWGEGCFGAYLGDDKNTWNAYDATELVKNGAEKLPVLIDSGLDDEFLADQLYPQNLQAACDAADFPITLRMQDGYDHSYHFISTFIGEHLAFHEKQLRS
ncbi:S-formylglutathione hydrolase [Cocleimonas sp. KMM 6892]|uniref:S-formylglutathione hydrolase n=1 Tax=unclassified Cocleimonas TaxID=2639732 RepID=UPI002DC04381|nr:MULTISPECIES: S-formylglutathione hydrolase [unclassified Cocleimonas]MEB8432890.1 S-formylglutathione hydrolase [Cocleimonas sp. KMM 6892]MEC4716129.1 S-formylglutathione hydrolase [Cocleimonas sp. KMM 6895]MEC4745590.1 S-formylglutathione hydrolase [Cocleimonas sp. KMM 6896]